jgi:serine/threonine protein kinase
MPDRSKVIEDLFQAALTREAGERRVFLDSVCHDDDLRREVEALLLAHARTQPLLTRVHNQQTEPQSPGHSDNPLIGRSIGRYFVDSLVGKGGMGEVYLAFDQHLPRRIALKVLPARFTNDPVSLQRFILEAHAASSLNHPNIITIHEIGHVSGIHFIAAEFVEGETLRARLSGDKLTPIASVDIAIGIAQALVAAHAAGIVHRDIKPENVMIRPDGYLKVLDFGLAKLVERSDTPPGPNQITPGVLHTEYGSIIGTPRYMSPEQFSGRPADARSDIFSAGVVLYEMLTGIPPFTGASPKDVAAAILTAEPVPVRGLESTVSVELEVVVTRSIQKLPDDRYQTAGELLDALVSVRTQLGKGTDGEHGIANHGASNASPKRQAINKATAVILLTLFVSLGVLASKSCVPPPPVSTLSFAEVYSWKCERGEGTISARFSHDAGTIAFTMLKDNWRGVWLKKLADSKEPVLATSTGYNSQWPIWSPDDKSLAFVSDRDGEPGIWIASLADGTQRRLITLERSGARTRSWSRDGRKIFFESSNNLFALDVASKSATQLTKMEPRASYRGFSVSPTDDRICFVDSSGGQPDVWVAQLDGSAARKITNDPEEDRFPIWHPDGKRVVYVSKRGTSFQIFIADTSAGAPRQVTVGPSDHLVSDVSTDGTKLLDVGSHDDADLFSIDTTTGKEEELTSGSVIDLWPEISPDGKRLAYQSTPSLGSILSSAIFVRPSTKGALPTSVASDGFGPVWAPSSERMAFFRLREGRFQLFAVEPGQREQLLTSDGVLINGYNQLPSTKYGSNVAWSPDAGRIAYCSRTAGVPNVWEVRSDGTQARQLSNNLSANKTVYGPLWSPDGDKLTFVLQALPGPDDSRGSWDLCIAENGQSRVLYSARAPLRTCAWTRSGAGLIVAVAGDASMSRGYPMKVLLFEVSLDGESRLLTSLESTYFWSVLLTPQGNGIGFVSNRDRSDNIWVSDTLTNPPRKLSSNSEPKVYIPSIAWSQPAEVFFARQSSLGFINIVENFK